MMLRLSVWLVAIAGLAFSASAQLPAFPGAEGFGALASGGRLGDVYHVTSLSSSSTTPGLFAYGIANAPATGAGVSADCLDMSMKTANVILDHCDALFSTDENFSSFNSPPENMTLQWSFNAWRLLTHSAGGLWYVNHATSHHSLWAQNHTRNPKALPSGLLDWVNIVTFDYGIGFILGDSTVRADYRANVENCFFISLPGNKRPYSLSRSGLDTNDAPTFSLFLTNRHRDTAQQTDVISNSVQTGASNGGYYTFNFPTALGSNPNLDDHTNQVPAGAFVTNSPAGYTLLEKFLHFKAKSLADNLTWQDMDLRAYTCGFTNKAPVSYTIANVSTGAVTLVGGNIAHFVPPPNYFGRASFDFTVTDGDANSWTQKLLLFVSATAPPRNLIRKGDGTTNFWSTNAPNFSGAIMSLVVPPNTNVLWSFNSVSGILTAPNLRPVLGSPSIVAGQPMFKISGAPGTFPVQASTNLSA